jgi:dihydrofolate reductase
VLRQVAEGVLIHESEFCQSNAVVVHGRAGVLLIDPGVHGYEMAALANDLSDSGQTVVAGFSTHPHWDHLLWHARLGAAPRYGTARCPVPPGHAALLIEERGVLVAGDMLSDVLIPMLDLNDTADPIEDYLAGLRLLGCLACTHGRRSYCRTRYRGGLLMRSVTYSMGVSLDGYIVGPDGDFDWTAPDEEVFRFVTDEIREVGVHLLGRRLYETMLYWETADQDPSLDDSMLEWAAIWKPLPKVVFSTTLSAVQGNARLASGGLAEEIERLRAEPGEGDIAIGGATLAAEAAALGLIDEYRARVYPVLVGGGIPFFPQRERRVDLELVETRTFSSRVVYLRYRVAR